VRTLERRLLAFFAACWVVGLLRMVNLLPPVPTLAPTLYLLYSFAGTCGWIAGNVHVHRSRDQPRRQRRWNLTLYLVGTPAIACLLWSLHPNPVLVSAPLVPVYSFGVFAVLFAVPVVLRPRLPPGRR